MEKLSDITEGFEFYEKVKKRFKERAAKASIKYKEENADKEPSNVDIAYQMLKADQFDVDAYMKVNKGVPRDKMPQIDNADLDSFIMHFSNKYKMKKQQMPVGKLKPTQTEINMDKVKSMIKDQAKWQERIFLVSKDNYVADGHHQMIQGVIHDPETLVTVYKVALPIEKLLQIMRKLKISTFRDTEDKPK